MGRFLKGFYAFILGFILIALAEAILKPEWPVLFDFHLENHVTMQGEEEDLPFRGSKEKALLTMQGEEEDLSFRDSKEEALQTANFSGYSYMKSIHDIVWETETEEYVLLYYHGVSKNKKHEGAAMCKFKIRENGGEKQYALIQFSVEEFIKQKEKRREPLEAIRMQAIAYDYMSDYSIEGGKRFFWGSTWSDTIRGLKIEGQSPTGIIEYTVFGETEYFWYYEDIDSDKLSWAFTIEMEE